MASSIEGRVRSLERKLARELAYLAVLEFVDAVMLRWDDFAASGQDALFLVQDLGADLVSLPTLPAAAAYLNRCLDEARPPDPRHLTTRLAPWITRPQRSWK